MLEEFAREQETREQLVKAIGAVIKERSPKAYEALRFYFEQSTPGLTITMNWETLAAILLVGPTDALDKGDF